MLCGIDEAGRGPLAGDLVMAGCILLKHINGIGDSKKLSAKKREALFEQIIQHSRYAIVKFSPKEIDTLGISACLALGLQTIKNQLACELYLFDGNTNFGVSGIMTRIKADATVPEVSAASIIAKVTHDRDICELSKIYPEYELHLHKGYGTKRHVELIAQHGYSPIHRKSYKIKSLSPTLF